MNSVVGMFWFGVITLASLGVATTSAVALNAPKPQVITKTVTVKEASSKACMRRDEAGKVMASSVMRYSEATKEEPNAFSFSTFVTFKMVNGISRVCHFSHRDLTKNMKVGLIFNATGGEKEL